MNTTVTISGMTCGHCVMSVKEEIEALPGVTGVDVNLVAGGLSTATVTAEREITVLEISEAVAEAGYTVVAENA
ncbi:copper chaperone [Galactobacter valiniphilus]|uniref:Copper chaperone n=1 Tax=Galactobacter valiniphilus TaxID=2676122 RepID=A0A399JAA9_9MICC|nr:heavy-metal-associated domain-containing protein [Galactobacter valiniphilus]RII41457.1 copper chaperone [Galactobacter valiniphilus]